jgi:hypothetical protein
VIVDPRANVVAFLPGSFGGPKVPVDTAITVSEAAERSTRDHRRSCRARVSLDSRRVVYAKFKILLLARLGEVINDIPFRSAVNRVAGPRPRRIP